MTRILVVGATGGIGRHVVEQALEAGYDVRALVRDPRKAPTGAEAAVGDLTAPDTLAAAVDGVDAVVFTHGSAGAPEAVDYGGVRNVLTALGDRPARIALMTAIGVTDHAGAYDRSIGVHDWKRRSERLVRSSGRPYTIVRPGWFDYNRPDEHHLELLQGDIRHAGDPSDGVVSRAQIAQVLLAALSSDHAVGKTFELVAATGPAQDDLDALFAPLAPDTGLDGPYDTPNLPLDDEPPQVRADLLQKGSSA
jgi:uncharacterized protein YbjT (DUF2867 family)